MRSEKKPVEPKADGYADWYPKLVAARGKDFHWIDTLTPAERRQFDAEARWAGRAFREDLPGPRRVDVADEYF